MLPSRIREQAGPLPHWVLTRGLDSCLALYTPERWDDLVSRVTAAPFTKKTSRQFQRMLFSKAVELSPDKAGRILVPDYLRKLVPLEKTVVFVGVADHVELWDAATWDTQQEAQQDEFESLAEDLFG